MLQNQYYGNVYSNALCWLGRLLAEDRFKGSKADDALYVSLF